MFNLCAASMACDGHPVKDGNATNQTASSKKRLKNIKTEVHKDEIMHNCAAPAEGGRIE